MKLEEIVSVYLAKVYSCNRNSFNDIVAAFNERANHFETDWHRHNKSQDKVVFKKGHAIAPTFNYNGTTLEVRVIFEYLPEAKQMKLSVGNWGFPFEPLLSKRRYGSLLENVHGFILDIGTIEEVTAASV